MTDRPLTAEDLGAIRALLARDYPDWSTCSDGPSSKPPEFADGSQFPRTANSGGFSVDLGDDRAWEEGSAIARAELAEG